MIKKSSFNQIFNAVATSLLFLIIVSCSEYKKVLKSDDLDRKYEMANRLYEEGKCTEALPLIEDLIPRYSLTQRGAEVYFLYAKSYYCIGDYDYSAYYFRRFTEKFPNHEKTEKGAFMIALSSVKKSPSYELDQTATNKAISQLQLFLNRYPNTSLKDSCNKLIDKMRSKLERKEFNKSQLYYHMEDYKSAVNSLKTTMELYPDSDYSEEVRYMLVKSNYYLAKNSVASKKEERLENTVKSYRNFANNYENSNHMKELKKLLEKTNDELKAIRGD